MFKKFQMLGKAIKAVKPNVPETKKEKLLRDLKILKQKTKASGAKLKQTQFELKNPKFKGKDLTFKTKTGKSESNKERYKRIQKENTKVFKGMIDKAFKNVKTEKKATGGRIGKMGGGMMGRRMGYQSGMSVKGDNKRDIRKTESMTGASKSSKREKGKTKFGMLSVKAGIDKNPNPTLADRIAGAKMKKGKA
jgi:hypothetical protein